MLKVLRLVNQVSLTDFLRCCILEIWQRDVHVETCALGHVSRLVLGKMGVRHCIIIILIIDRVNGSKIKLEHFLDIFHALCEFRIVHICSILNQFVVVI